MSSAPAGPAATGARSRGGIVLSLASRFATSGRTGWARTMLIALGVGLGVAVLLLGASVPTALDGRTAREAARADVSVDGRAEPRPGPGVLRIDDVDSTLGGLAVRGRLLAPAGPGAPAPPGLNTLPRNGEMALSPALRTALASSQGDLLSARLPYRDVATIGDAGLLGPDEMAFYAGDSRLVDLGKGRLIDHFGGPVSREPLDPVLSLVALISIVSLLLPVAVFVATAARFGVERRDRRLAALRMLGLDARSTRRLAAAEALWAAVIGDAVGILFFLAGRQLLRGFSVGGLSVFPSDARPAPVLAMVVLVAVPAVAVAATLLGLRAVVIEPLGVVRSARPARRRLWWRLLLPALGVGLLTLQVGSFTSDGSVGDPRLVTAGVVLLLGGVLAVLPWLVDAGVGRLGAGPVPWQLAVRRLQAGGSTSGRVVGGVAVAVTGLIALQALFGGLAAQYTRPTGSDLSRADLVVQSSGFPDMGRALQQNGSLNALAGVRTVHTLGRTSVTPEGGQPQELVVGDCAALAEVAKLTGCLDGDVFLLDSQELPQLTGRTVLVGDTEDDASTGASALRWQIPADANPVQGRVDPTGFQTGSAVLATPGSLDTTRVAADSVTAYVRTASQTTPTLARIVRAATQEDPTVRVRELSETVLANPFTAVRRGLYAGALAVLATIGASLLVSSSEQMRERARVFAALAAVGVRRSTLSWSLLLGNLIPVLLGAALAVVTGLGLGVLLLIVVNAPPRVDLAIAASTAGLAGAVVLAVSALGITGLSRTMRPQGLRSE